MQIDFHDLLVATSVLVGFQVTLFIWRIDREVEKKPEQHSWLPPSDWLARLSMLCFVGRIIAPILGAIDIQTAKNFFGLGALLTIGHLFGLVGHYELFTLKLLARLVLRLWAATVVAFNSAAKSSRCSVSVSLCGCTCDCPEIQRRLPLGCD